MAYLEKPKVFKLKALPFLMLILTLLACSFPPVIASRLTIELQNGTADVTIASSIHQNFTKLQDHAVVLTGQDLDVAREALDRAVKARLSGAIISDLAIKVTESGTMLNVTATFKVHNISSVNQKIVRVDCSWKSFEVPDDLVSQDISYNMVGKAYVKPTVLSYANSTWARFYLNETTPVFYQEAAEVSGNATLLDFRVLSKPLASWNVTPNLEKQQMIWVFPSERVLDLKATVQEPNGTRVYYAVIEVSSQIVGPSFATIDGDIIVSSRSGFEEPLMFAAVIAIVAITLAIYIYQRKLPRKEVRPRR